MTNDTGDDLRWLVEEVVGTKRQFEGVTDVILPGGPGFKEVLDTLDVLFLSYQAGDDSRCCVFILTRSWQILQRRNRTHKAHRLFNRSRVSLIDSPGRWYQDS